MKDEIEAGGKISGISETTVDKWLAQLKAEKKIKQNPTSKVYRIPKTATKNKLPKNKKNTEKSSKSQDDTNQLNKELEKTVQKFSEIIEEDVDVAKYMQDTVFLLDSAVTLLDTVNPDTHYDTNRINESKYKCKIYIAGLKKIINEKIAHLLVENSYENKYQQAITDTWKSYTSENDIPKMSMVFYKISNFRDVFSGIVLQIRNRCFSNCKKFADRSTYNRDAIYASCKLVSISLNEMCRCDFDLVIDSYDIDLDMYKINVSELKLISDYTITQLYCDGKYRDFNFDKKSSESQSDHTILFYPHGGIVNDNSRHVISIMLQCVEFSFVIKGKQKMEGFTFLDHIKNDVEQIEAISIPYNLHETILITAEVEGNIKKILDDTNGREFSCAYCYENHKCNRWIGWPHDSGILDGNGKKYWLVIECPNSNNQI